MKDVSALAPAVEVKFWRHNPPGGLLQVKDIERAHFAVLSARAGGSEAGRVYAARFVLPEQRPQFDIACRAAAAAFRFGQTGNVSGLQIEMGRADV